MEQTSADIFRNLSTFDNQCLVQKIGAFAMNAPIRERTKRSLFFFLSPEKRKKRKSGEDRRWNESSGSGNPRADAHKLGKGTRETEAMQATDLKRGKREASKNKGTKEGTKGGRAERAELLMSEIPHPVCSAINDGMIDPAAGIHLPRQLAVAIYDQMIGKPGHAPMPSFSVSTASIFIWGEEGTSKDRIRPGAQTCVW